MKEDTSDTHSLDSELPSERARLKIFLVDVTGEREAVIWQGNDDRSNFFDRLWGRWVRRLRYWVNTTKGRSS